MGQGDVKQNRVLATVVAAAAVVATSAFVAGRLSWALAGCYFGSVPLPDQPICGSGLWGREWVPVVLLATALIVLGASVALGGAGLWQQFGRAGRLRRSLEARTIPPPPKLERCAEHAGVRRFRCTDVDIPIALTVGVRQPHILVSKPLVELLDKTELEAVLLHEQCHLERRDPLAFGVARTAAGMGFVLPALREHATGVVLSAELAADAAAVERCGRRSLLSALSKLVDAPHDAAPAAIGSVRGMLEQRLRVLAGERAKLRATRRARVMTLVGLGALASAASAVVGAFLMANGVVS